MEVHVRVCVWKGGKYGVDGSMELGVECVGYIGVSVWRCVSIEVAPEYGGMSVWRYE